MPHRSIEEDGFGKFLARVPAFRSQPEALRAVDWAWRLGGSVAIALVATALRFWLDPYLPAGFPYLTFFPAVILTGFLLGMPAALLSVVLCGLAAWYWFIPPAESFALSYQSAVALGFYVVVVAIDLSILQLALIAYRGQARARAAVQQMLALEATVSEEVDHRMKNMLATVSGLISLSKRHADSPEALARQLQSRLAAMGEAVRLLRTSLSGTSGDMVSTFKSGLMPLGIVEGDKLELRGAPLALNSSAIVALNLMVHELGTNAIKYGALSRETGKVLVSWQDVRTGGGAGHVEITWTEQGGPEPQVPTRSGFGSDLIARMATSLGGEGKYEFVPGGVVFRMVLGRDFLV